MTLIVEEEMTFLHLPNYEGTPRSDNGEDIIRAVLTKLNIWHEYETIVYLFRANDGGVRPGFQPDFPLFEAEGVPVCNVEVTWPDHPMQSERRKARRCTETLADKREKIMTTWGLYNIPTLLIGHQATMAIKENPRLLLGLLGTIRDEELEGDGQGCYYPTGDDLKSRRDWRR